MARQGVTHGLVLLIASVAMVPAVAEGRAAEAGHVAYYSLSGAETERSVDEPVALAGAPERRMAIVAMAPDEQGKGAVVLGRSGGDGKRPALWRLRPEVHRVVDVTLPPDFTCAEFALVHSPAGVFLGSEYGLLMVRDWAAARFDRFVGVQLRSFCSPSPEQVRAPARALVTDHGGNVWAAGSTPLTRSGGDWRTFIMFPSDRGRWRTDYAGRALDRPYPLLSRWRAPVAAMAGDPLHAGVWVYGAWAGEKSDLMHVDPTMAGVLAVRDPTSAVPAGVAVPAVSGPLLTADVQGRVWLAGDTLGGSRVYVFDGKTFSEVTPRAMLLRARRLTQLLTDPKGRLYATTDGVGVLTYDGKEWRPHPINDHLPTLEGTELKPVSCMCLDTGGNLWIGTDNNVICWREGK